MNFRFNNRDWSESWSVLTSSLPLAAAHAADIAMFLTDMAIVGRVGISELAGVAIAEQIVFLMISVLGTILSYASVLVAKAYGSGEKKLTEHILNQGLLIALILSVPATLIALNLSYFLSFTDIGPEVINHAKIYSSTVSWCIPSYLVFVILRSYLITSDNSKLVVKITTCAVILNAAMSFALTFGIAGINGLGIAGTGMATSIVTLLMTVSMGLSIRNCKSGAGVGYLRIPHAIDLKLWSDVFKKGIPSAGATILEDSLFVVTAIVIGSFGAIALSAHYVVNSLVNIGNVLSSGIGDATSIRVAINNGRKDLSNARLACTSGVVLCGVTTAIFGAAMIIAPEPLVQIFMDKGNSNGNEVLQIAIQLLTIAAISQVFEGIQVVVMRALRGLEDTWIPFLIAVFGHWGIAFPLGLILAKNTNLGVASLWIGLTCGFATTMIAFLWRFNHLSKN